MFVSYSSLLHYFSKPGARRPRGSWRTRRCPASACSLRPTRPPARAAPPDVNGAIVYHYHVSFVLSFCGLPSLTKQKRKQSRRTSSRCWRSAICASTSLDGLPVPRCLMACSSCARRSSVSPRSCARSFSALYTHLSQQSGCLTSQSAGKRSEGTQVILKAEAPTWLGL